MRVATSRPDTRRLYSVKDKPSQVDSVAGPPPSQVGVFFDVDNTMIRGASIYYFARGLAARDYFTTKDLLRFAQQQVHFRLIGKEDPGGMGHMKDTALAFIAGREVEQIKRHGEDIYDELMADKVWPASLAQAKAHLAAGHRVWLVTATPIELAEIIANRLGLTGAVGTLSEISDGKYTGRLNGKLLHGQEKVHAIEALAAAEGLDLANCVAYSDSSNDLPMLQAVGTAIAVNPDRQLRRFARAHHWQVRDYRRARKAALIGLPTAAGMGVIAGGVIAGLAMRRRLRDAA